MRNLIGMFFFLLLAVPAGAEEMRGPNFSTPLPQSAVVGTVIEVVDGMTGDSLDSGLPELCSWYRFDGVRKCVTPSNLRAWMPANERAEMLAVVAAALGKSGRKGDMNPSFVGFGPEFCEDVVLLAKQKGMSARCE